MMLFVSAPGRSFSKARISQMAREDIESIENAKPGLQPHTWLTFPGYSLQ